MFASTRFRRRAKIATGIAVATPTFALLQATLLLLEYRMNHGDAPRPESPSSGVVVATSESVSGSVGSSGSPNKPLRLLVIGDSLAAGVGVSQSSVPVLPQAIAQSLSQAQQGRAVYWTCVGTPGYSATQILQEIYELPPNPQSSLLNILEEWQREQRQAAQDRIESTTRKAKSWWKQRNENVDDGMSDASSDATPFGRIRNLWKRTVMQAQRDWHEVRNIFQDESVDVHGPEQDLEPKKEAILSRRRPTKRLLRKESILHPDIVGEYDVAIVLTGVNDLKDAFLPFMMSAQRKGQLADSRSEHQTDGGLKANLVLLVNALRSRMSSMGDDNSMFDHEKHDESEFRDVSSHTPNLDNVVSEDEAEGEVGPLMVFPAMPTAPISLSQLIPLCWFLVPLLRSMDRNKQILSELYPELVLFVEAPSAESFSQAENRNGPLWDDLDQERVWLVLTDIAQQASDRMEKMMKLHYESWTTDVEDEQEQGQYMLSGDAVNFLKEWEFKAPGSSLISADGIHPNDEGYRAWGRIIGRAIVKEWDMHAT